MARQPWYAGKHQDALMYLLIAIFFIELIVGGVAFFYGIMHAAPETPGGPPLARFPWLGWALAAFLAPVALLLIVHLAGTWVSAAITADEDSSAPRGSQAGAEELPRGLQRFYTAIAHAPLVVILLGILLMGAGLFFIDGAIAALGRFLEALTPHLPWIIGSIAALLAVYVVARAVLLYRQRKLDHEYAWRREVLERTGMVITDSGTRSLPPGSPDPQALAESPAIVDVTPRQLPPSAPENQQSDS